ncbi:aminoglycoside phosphotransferase family protein [Variovorax sp. J22R133]|uniref:phosphotransferase family protein n=1 Tax=Variovorax brevis TaxID=3053503 RepID=UPI00257665C9|nr:aminoglycoside phosphotransferase family protein [Variovorax sp. J22R133]MDM0113146.1 aminoglycoside phosphotransferase family protein [Variovorax sp. J22R133]
MTDDVLAALRRMKLIGPDEAPQVTPLTGGVSSLIVRVDTARGPLCVKRALPQLKVAALWEAPVERNRAEVAWMRIARRIVPAAVPEILGEDALDNAFAMRYLEPAEYPVWKSQLRDGVADIATAQRVGMSLSAIHSATANDAALARAFANDVNFHALRLEPYLLATAQMHPECADALTALVERTASTRRALVHGDVSPKNILVGANGPVLLDAECAWYGDPAFDLAFCLNHLLLKCVWRPSSADDFLRCFDALQGAYLSGVDWEARDVLEARAAALLPGLLLARIDGKSPVEYIVQEADRQRVRGVAIPLLLQTPSRLSDIRQRWSQLS